jgi:hypothetical protein
MNRVWSTLAVAALFLGATGCHHHNLTRNDCGNGHCGPTGVHGYGGGLHASAAAHRGNVPAPLPHGYQHQMGPGGPPTAQVAYPYYTTRGPRDFFLNEPAPLGH